MNVLVETMSATLSFASSGIFLKQPVATAACACAASVFTGIFLKQPVASAACA